MDHIFHLEEWIYLFNESLRIDVRFLFGLGAPVGWSDRSTMDKSQILCARFSMKLEHKVNKATRL